jgi:hypothetical protein
MLFFKPKNQQQAPDFNPQNPNDVSKFLELLFEQHSKGKQGADEATWLATQLAGTSDGRALLLNAHRVISAQIHKISEPKIFQAAQWIQGLTGKFHLGG